MIPIYIYRCLYMYVYIYIYIHSPWTGVDVLLDCQTYSQLLMANLLKLTVYPLQDWTGGYLMYPYDT